MCSTCGCGEVGDVTITRIGAPELKKVEGADLLTKMHHHHRENKARLTIEVEQDIMEKNDLQAKHNRFHFREGSITAINLVSSPGSGKTTLLEKTLLQMKDIPCSVIEGDQQTLNDANRIALTGAPVVQINTGKGCHLDAQMVHSAVHKLDPQNNSILFIENVGNLVCPAMFDLGEDERVAIISVTEGDDKPIKYPDMFASSDLCLINKIDLLPYVNFDVSKVKKYALQVNPRMEFIEISATRGHGMDAWIAWLGNRIKEPVTG